MGDWLEVKPQFPRGMKPLLADIRAAGFTPGLWIAPFMVGNRSRLYAEHPDWVVRDRASGEPLAPMTFYGEFRWHKRSEEYYVLDITHPGGGSVRAQGVPDLGARIGVAATSRRTSCTSAASTDRSRRAATADGLSRIEVWMRMVRLIREEIGDALWLASGSPIWAPIGWIDAVRIGRDIGVCWEGPLLRRIAVARSGERATSPTAFSGRPIRTASSCASASTISRTTKCTRSRCSPGSPAACS